MEDEIKTITLKRPVKLGDLEPITQIVLSEPTVKHIKAALKMPSVVESNTMLISLVAGIPLAAVDEMMRDDFNEAVDFLSGSEAVRVAASLRSLSQQHPALAADLLAVTARLDGLNQP